MTPAESSARGGKFLRNSTIEFLCMKGAVLAHGVAQQHIEYRTRPMAQLPVAVYHCAGFCLKIAPNSLIRLPKQRFRIGRLDFAEVAGERQRLPIQEITAAVSAIKGHLVSAQNEAGKRVPGIAHPRQIAPGIG